MSIIVKKLMRGKALSYLLGVVLAFCSLDASAFSICAVGDSITRGASHFTAHRVALEDKFAELGWMVEWKGTQSDASYGSSNPCEGYSGQNAEFIAGKYVSNAAKVAADVLLLHAGHNYDATKATHEEIVKNVTDAHAQIIAAARENNPKVIILYAKVITGGGTYNGVDRDKKYAYIPDLNEAIGVLGAELNTDVSPVRIVDMASDWNYVKIGRAHV